MRKVAWRRLDLKEGISHMIETVARGGEFQRMVNLLIPRFHASHHLTFIRLLPLPLVFPSFSSEHVGLIGV